MSEVDWKGMSEVDWKGMSEVDWKGMSKVDWSFELRASSSEGRGSRVVWYEVAVLGSNRHRIPHQTSRSLESVVTYERIYVLRGCESIRLWRGRFVDDVRRWNGVDAGSGPNWGGDVGDRRFGRAGVHGRASVG